jgi:hypothetical protein
VAGVPRVAVAEYLSEWQPGRIVGGAPEAPASAALRSWKVRPVRLDGLTAGDSIFVAAAAPADLVAHESWADYRTLGGPTGAPIATVLIPAPQGGTPVTGPDLPGDLALWSVFNDANPASHRNHAGGSPPLGLEVRQTVFAFDTTPGNAAFVRWTLVHEGTAPLESLFVTFWIDPDLGGAGDDLVGWDASLQMGYVYNATNTDNAYGTRPPALGVRLVNDSWNGLIGAFNTYIGGTDPQDSLETYNLIRGLRANGDEWLTPGTLEPTRFPFPGDPVIHAGWLDTLLTDKRLMVSAGPIDLVPGDSASILFEIVVGQGVDRLDSIRQLRCQAALVDPSFTGSERPYPSRLRLVAGEATVSEVVLHWSADGTSPRGFPLRRHAGDATDPWPDTSEPVATLVPDAGELAFTGPPLAPGERWTYGLFDPCDPLRPLDTVTLDGPGASFAFRTSSPTTSGGAVRLFFTLPAAGPAALEAFSVSGRRVLHEDLGTLSAGTRTIVVPGTAGWPSGLYFFRFVQGGEALVSRTVIVR